VQRANVGTRPEDLAHKFSIDSVTPLDISQTAEVEFAVHLRADRELG